MRHTRIFAMFCCIIVTFCLGTSLHAADEAKLISRPRVDLRSYIESLTPEECVAFLEENGFVRVPDFYADDYGRPHAKEVVLDIYDDPSSHSMVSRVEPSKFYKAIRNLLKWHKSVGCYPAVSVYVG